VSHILRSLYAGLIVGFSALCACPAPPPVKPFAPVDAERWNVTVDTDDPSWGPQEALVSIVVFEDFQCPYTKGIQPHLRALRHRFPDDLRIVFKALPLPFHQAADDLALAAFCAHEQGHFLPFHDALFERQEAALGDSLERLAESLEIAIVPFTQCLASPRPARRLQAHARLARKVRVGATPTLFTNGRRVTGEYPLEGLIRLVQSEIDTATVLANTVGRGPELYNRLLDGSQNHQILASAPVRLPTEPSPRRGHVGAPFEIAVWLNFSSGLQTRLAGALLKLQSERYPREDVTLLLQPFASPGDAHGVMAARIASCAVEQGRFWAFVQRLSVNDISRHQSRQSEAHLMAAAKSAQIDSEHLGICRRDPLREATDLARWAKDHELGIQTAPSLYINGRRYDGSLGWGPRALKRLLLIAESDF
jgi:protein-disulfide isomerase